MIPDLTAVVPAGGAGTRLWPLSRRAQPKFLLDLTGTGRTLLQQTWDRLDDVAARVCVVTGAGHAGAVARQLPGLDLDDLLAEPSPRDSAAAIGLAAAVVHARDPDAVVGSFAADHVIADAAAFAAAVGEAVAVARTGLLVTIGITPTAPGHRLRLHPRGRRRSTSRTRRRRSPSPSSSRSRTPRPPPAYVAEGYRWNAGMFVARASVLLDLLGEYRPALAAGLRRIGAAWDTPDRQQVLDEVWPELEKVADRLRGGRAGGGRRAGGRRAGGLRLGRRRRLRLAAAPCCRRPSCRCIGDGELLAADSSGVVVTTSGRVVALLGLQDVVVVDTPDAVLVAARSHAQQVKGVVDRLTAADRTDLL